MKAVKLAIRIVLSLAVSGVFVWLSLRHTDVRAVGAAIAGADPLRVVGYLGLLLVIHLIRTVRWGILLEPLGHVPFRRLNSASAVGFMLLMLLPLRLGELARPLLIARPPPGRSGVRIRRSGAMASCVVERIIDGLSVGVLGIVALHLLGTSASGRNLGFARNAALFVAVGFFSLCLSLVLAFFLRPQALRLTRALLAPLSPRLADRLAEVLDTFISALHLGSGLRVAAVLLLTALYWSTSAFALHLLAPAFGMHLGRLMAMTVLAIQVVGVMVPAGPGMIGTIQFFTQVGLSLFFPMAVPAAAVQAAAFANTVWILQFGQQVCLGLMFLLAGHVSLRGLLLRDAATPDDEEGETARSPAAPAAP
jgi:glycosyltransferase 2 family protein